MNLSDGLNVRDAVRLGRLGALTIDLGDLPEFARWHVASGDVDPAYPVLRALADRAADDEARLRFVLLYVAYYDLGSALAAWTAGAWRWGEPLEDRASRFPTGTERRGHRVPARLVAHLADLDRLAREAGSLTAWLLAWVRSDDPLVNWRSVSEAVASVRGNGRWAAYKTAELLAEVLGWPLEAPDAGHATSTGPRAGLGAVIPAAAEVHGNTPPAIARLDAMTERLRSALAAAEVDLPVSVLETVLCDWRSVLHGRYYVGHDIDLMAEQVARSVARGVLPGPEARHVAIARAASFDPMWLGEWSGWHGVRADLRTAYRDRGVIRWWDE